MNILILGMPNVGKTSLYNLITNKNNNIIHDTIGTTRDWHVSPLKSNNNIDVYDTPGIINQKSLVTKSVSNIIRKIDIFVYVIDYIKLINEYLFYQINLMKNRILLTYYL